MDALPDQILYEIFARLESISEKTALSLSCKRLYDLGNEATTRLKIGCGLNPANEALASLCHRFQNLETLEISYSGWRSKLGKQMDDEGLLILSRNCPSLLKLTLSYCTVITDAGLSHLASCLKLSALKLNFTPRITGCGVLSIVISCKRLRSFHLIRCLNVGNGEWLEYLGKLEWLEDLSVKNCRAIGDDDLIKLGTCWSKLKRVQIEVYANYKNGRSTLDDPLLKQHISCENLVELSLVNCIMDPGRGLSCVLPACPNLEKIHLDNCFGVRDCDIIAMAQSSRNLVSLSLQVPFIFTSSFPVNYQLRLTDTALLAVAQNCSRLESVRISYSDGEFPLFSSFSTDAILALIKNCPIRELSLDHFYSFGDSGMEALSAAEWLESLELVRCQEISDEGIQFLSNFPRLRVVRLIKCLGVTDEGVKPLVGSHKLALLVVEDCPQLSEKGVQGAAKNVSFRQDLSWMY
uniref:F-box domain-containing protein n=1 Tax=Kalanchoe fedtschenkoi TaxID=63787 RepID=A0A7N0VCA7_KALFE